MRPPEGPPGRRPSLSSEGRIRPSYIAAAKAAPTRSPSSTLRGANSPLLHCGLEARHSPTTPPPAPRGEFAPPTLRLDDIVRYILKHHSSEGRIRPSYIAAWASISTVEACLSLRGANSPLLHCGNCASGKVVTFVRAPRGEFAPPTLRLEQSLDWVGQWGLRGANSPLLHCGG